MNRKNSRRNLLILIICACAGVFNGCGAQDAKDNKDAPDQSRERIGAEDFMPERVRVVYVRSCESCHGPDGHGVTGVAPDIYRAKYHATDEWEKYLRESKGAHPAGNPPPLWLDADETKQMAEYLELVTRRNQ